MDAFYDIIRHGIQNLVQAGYLPSALKYTFVINALMSALLIGPTLGAIGTLVVAKRMAFFSSAIGNAALTGIAIGIIAGEPVAAPYVSLFSFSILFAIFLNFSKNRSGMSHDTLIGVFLAASLAVGSTLMLSVTKKINVHILDNFLFGSIITANSSDITLLLIVVMVTIFVGMKNYNRLLLSGLNPSLASVRKVPVMVYDYLFVVLIALITVASVKIVGAVLVEALLVIPAAAARNVSRSLKSFVITSVIFSTISAVAGIMLPMQLGLSIPTGGAIIIIATIFFLVTLLIRMLESSGKVSRVQALFGALLITTLITIIIGTISLSASSEAFTFFYPKPSIITAVILLISYFISPKRLQGAK